MQSIRTAGIGVLLAAAAAVAAIAAPAASALPEFSAPFSKTFTATSGAALLETVKGVKTTCKTDTASGEVNGPQSGTIQIIFTGCKMGKVPCNTPGIAPGTIATGVLSIRFGYLSKAKKTVGADVIEPAGLPMLTYGCGSATFVKVIGSVVGQVTPVNTLVTPPAVFKLKFAQTLGFQKFTNLEASPVDILESSFGGPFETTGLANNESLLFTEPVTLSA